GWTSSTDFPTANPLEGASGGGSADAFLVQIHAPLPPPPGSLQFSAAVYNASETDGTATVTVTRTGGAGGAVSAQVATSNGTALAGIDYVSSTPLVSWADGDAAPKTVTITLLDDNKPEAGNETINLTLVNLSGEAQLGSQKTAQLVLSEPPSGSLQFSA